MLRFDFVDLSGARVNADGFIHDEPVLTRSGVFKYHNPDGTTRLEYRPPEEVFHADHLASMRGAPITDGHNGRTVADSQHIIGTVLTDGVREDQNLVADVVIYQPKRLGTRRELSLGYSLDLDETPGVTPEGERYDAIQRNPRVNHLAVVLRGRAGNARLRMDHDDAALQPVELQETLPVAEQTAPASAPSAARLVLTRIDGIEYSAPPEVVRDLDRLRDDLKAANQRADKAEAERDSLTATVTKHATEVAQARADAATGARARVKLETEAGKHGVDTRSDQSDRDICEAVIRKIRGDNAKFDGRSDEYVTASFDLAVADASKSAETTARNRVAIVGPVGTGARADAMGAPQFVSAAAARDRMIRAMGR